jgi:transposase
VSKSIVTSKPKTGKTVGIDLGLKNSINCSTGFKSGKILMGKLDNKIKRLNHLGNVLNVTQLLIEILTLPSIFEL